jgi:ATP-binding cassette subfamily F protein 3
MIKVVNLNKSFGKQTLFDDISFNINPGEKIGLTGRNGHGKTTLIRMIVGEEHIDSGEIIIPKNYRIGYVTQHIAFKEKNVLEEGCRGLPEWDKDNKWKVEKILFGLGFTSDDMLRDPSEFSGGYQVRLNLTKTLVSEPGILLLDEPTNYLDIISIRWLESYLRQWKGELILITHDRSFMDSVITHTVGIRRQKIRKIEGTTDKLYDQILKEEEIHEKTRINDEKKRRETELFISRFRAKARLAGMVQSRVKALEKKQSLDKLEKIKELEFSFNYKSFNAKTLMTVEDISFSYNADTSIVKDFNLTIRSDDRICVIGKNGRGKTTLLRLLATDLAADSGEMSIHPNARSGYFAQTNVINLNNNFTIEEEIVASGCEKQTARNIAGAMMFEGDDALKKISVLSGGEKSRVLLGKILATPSNLIFLDEPTNHLDMESCDALMLAIDSFPGAVVMVTHNELFLRTLASRFIIFQASGVTLFDGSYNDFLEKIGWEEEKNDELNDCANNKRETLYNKKDIRKMRSSLITMRSKEIKPIDDMIAEIENSISEKENSLKIKNDEIIKVSETGKSREIEALSKEIHALKKEIDMLFEKYENLNISLEEKRIYFESELKKLED